MGRQINKHTVDLHHTCVLNSNMVIYWLQCCQSMCTASRDWWIINKLLTCVPLTLSSSPQPICTKTYILPGRCHCFPFFLYTSTAASQRRRGRKRRRQCAMSTRKRRSISTVWPTVCPRAPCVRCSEITKTVRWHRSAAFTRQRRWGLNIVIETMETGCLVR